MEQSTTEQIEEFIDTIEDQKEIIIALLSNNKFQNNEIIELLARLHTYGDGLINFSRLLLAAKALQEKQRLSLTIASWYKEYNASKEKLERHSVSIELQ